MEVSQSKIENILWECRTCLNNELFGVTNNYTELLIDIMREADYIKGGLGIVQHLKT